VDLAHTDQRSKDFMGDLRFDLRFEVGDSTAHVVHGSPRKVNEYLFEDKPASLYERLAAAEDANTLVFGHTHKPWVHEYGGVLFVNCGSVGKPKDGDPRSGFALLHEGDTGLHVTIEWVPYDAEAVAREVAAAGLPEDTPRSSASPRKPGTKVAPALLCARAVGSVARARLVHRLALRAAHDWRSERVRCSCAVVESGSQGF